MEILGNFGFEPILFVAQIANFLIIFWVLKKFLYKPVLKILDERKEKIEKGLKDAEEAEKRLLDASEKEEQILKKAQSDAKKLIEESISVAEDHRAQKELETKKQVAEMINTAREQIKEETNIASKKLEEQVGRLAVEFLEKSTKGIFNDKEQQEVIKEAIKKMKK
jgi:F-type H+-transporting ATPase subunit b